VNEINAATQYEDISVLVNNAGVMNNGPLESIGMKEATDMIDVNTTH
jgi:NADP-dependent 3-hydroxy acid dehydrogenase YdfG